MQKVVLGPSARIFVEIGNMAAAGRLAAKRRQLFFFSYLHLATTSAESSACKANEKLFLLLGSSSVVLGSSSLRVNSHIVEGKYLNCYSCASILSLKNYCARHCVSLNLRLMRFWQLIDSFHQITRAPGRYKSDEIKKRYKKWRDIKVTRSSGLLNLILSEWS